MALPICVEVFIRVLLHTAKFCMNYWFWVLVLILILSLLKHPLALGLVGWGVNAVGLIPTGIGSAFTPFIMALIWGIMIWQAPINIVFRIFLFPVFVASGFAWDALTNLGSFIPYVGVVLGVVGNLFPLTAIVAVILKTPTLNYVLVGLVSFIWAKFFIWGGCNWLNMLLKAVEKILTWLYTG